MKIETKYRCSFCMRWFWDKEQCKVHEEEHQCYHCKNLILWGKDKEGSLDCECDAEWLCREPVDCRYHVEGKPNKEHYIEEEK